ncbi:MAG TPA: single-stranded DNA-binding protein [Chloroflexia bacterium]|nr:single-stranded DNA-binding protein [Chloroflexia bacterium]
MYNKIILVGNLSRDPEMRYTPSGSSVTNFSMATNEKWTGQDGQQQERTIWWRVSVFGKAGEAVNEYLKKGSKVLVEGRMTADPKTGNPRLWQGQDGQTRASYEVTAQTVKFLSGRGDTGGSNGGGGMMESEPIDESEIPF